MVPVVSLLSFRCFGGFVSVFRWFRSGVSVVSAVPVVSVVSFRWFRFGVSGFSTCHSREPSLVRVSAWTGFPILNPC